MPRIKLKHVEMIVFVVACLFLLETTIRNTRVQHVSKETTSLSEEVFKLPHVNETGQTKEAIKLLILGYQRSGSSFMGSHFNSNPDVFYWFEPIDGLYSAMYGTAAGWNIPTDIFTFENDSIRTIPTYEVSAIAESLNNIFNCNVRALPTDILVHTFVGMWLSRQKRLSSFYRCTMWVQNKYNTNMNQCRKKVKSFCPSRFGTNFGKHETCRKLMWDVTHLNRSTWFKVLSNRFSNVSTIMDKPVREVVQHFVHYHSCVQNLTRHLEICFPKLESVCKNSSIRVVKTVRVTMDTVEAMLESKSDLQTLHLVRDPRAVAISRLKQPSFRGRKSGTDLRKEALAYCQTAAHDARIAKSLATLHSGKVFPLVYEDFVNNPLVKLNEMYRFLNITQSGTAQGWLNEYTSVDNKNSTIRAYLWMKDMTLDVASEINDVCSNLTKEISYKWQAW